MNMENMDEDNYSSILDLYSTDSEHFYIQSCAPKTELGKKPTLLQSFYKSFKKRSSAKPKSPQSAAEWEKWVNDVVSDLDKDVDISLSNTLVRRIERSQTLERSSSQSSNCKTIERSATRSTASVYSALSHSDKGMESQMARHHVLVEILFLIHFVSKAVAHPKKQNAWQRLMGKKQVTDTVYPQALEQYTLLKREMWDLGPVDKMYGDSRWFDLYQNVMSDVPFLVLVERYSNLTF